MKTGYSRFHFDKNILDDLEDKKDRRVEFIREALTDMQEELKKHSSPCRFFMIPRTVLLPNC
jgi:deoxyribodipyrimidine photo-lyase